MSVVIISIPTTKDGIEEGETYALGSMHRVSATARGLSGVEARIWRTS